MLTTALLIAVLGGEPQCALDLKSCTAKYGDGTFGLAWSRLRQETRKPYNETLRAGDVDPVCTMAHWMSVDQCNSQCPFRFVITAPASLQMTVCLKDSDFEPYDLPAHIDQTHPLHAKEFELIAVGNNATTREGCFADDYNSTYSPSVSGKIALMRESSTCDSPQRALNAKTSGAVFSIEASKSTYNSINNHMTSIDGTISSDSPLKTFPVMKMPQHFSSVLFEQLDQGVSIVGKVELACDPVSTVETQLSWDEQNICPYPRLADVCQRQPLRHNRICNRCPLEFLLGGDAGKTVCLWGNNLLPRKASTTMLDAAVTQSNDVLLLGATGCAAIDYAGLKGKIVFVKQSYDCLEFQQVRLAEAAEVRLFVLIGRAASSTDLIEGPSQFVNIPVHSLSQDHLEVWENVTNGITADGDGNVYLPAGRLQAGVEVLYTWPTAPPALIQEEKLSEEEDFVWSSTVVFCMVLIALQIVVLAMIIGYQRRYAIDIPNVNRHKNEREGCSIPLGIASMGVSLSLLFIIALVAFLLAYMAGKDSTDTALEDGRTATTQTFVGAVENVESLAKDMSLLIINRVSDEMQSLSKRIESKASTIKFLHRDYDGTWDSFDSVFEAKMEIGFIEDSILTYVYTTNGYFSSRYLRQIDYTGIASDTVGWGYDLYVYAYSVLYRYSYPYGIKSAQMYNVSNMLGGYFGSPVEFVRELPERSMKYHITKRNFLMVEEFMALPLSIFTPLYNRFGDFMGAVESRIQLTLIGTLIDNAVTGASMQNMSAMLVDLTDFTLVAATPDLRVKRVEMVIFASAGTQHLTDTLHSVFDSYETKLKAFAFYANNTENGWIGHSGSFDQQKHYIDRLNEFNLVRIGVDAGKVVDVGPNNYDLEMRGGSCGDCTEYDATLQKTVMRFDGSNVLHMYNNITTSHPLVASTRTSADTQPFASSAEEFQKTKIFSDGTECVLIDYIEPWSAPVTSCLLRPTFMIADGGAFTIHLKVKPDQLYNTDWPNSDTPRLFTDTLEGEASVRIFANGQLFLNVISYGCVTDAVPGGLPVGQWSTLTAVVYQSEAGRHCEMYVNGEIHHARMATVYWDSRFSDQPYYLGMGFKGLMDDISIFSAMRVLPTEIMNLHLTGDLIREVPSKVYYASTERFLMDGEVTGIDWSIATLLPEDDVLRNVSANNAKIQTNLVIQEDNTQKKLRQKLNETAMVLVVIGLFSVTIFLIFNNLLTRPFANYAVLMTEASIMHIDEVPRGESYISELRAMNRAMIVLLKNLKEYKSYMPQSLQLDTIDTDDVTGSQSSDHRRSSVVSKAASILSRSSASRSRRSGLRSSGCSGNDRVKLQVSVAGQKRMELMCQLAKKKFSYIVINMRGWHAHMHQRKSEEILSIHSGVLQSILGCFAFNKGIAEVFTGDRFMCSFNAARITGNHKVAAAATAVLVGDKMRTDFSLSVSSSVVSGEGRVGNMGNDSMKRFSFVSPVVTWGHALERLARVREVAVLADHFVTDDVKCHYKMKLADQVSFPKRHPKPIRVAELCGKTDTRHADEWMYEMQEAEKGDVYKTWNDWATGIFEGRYEV